jgi:hypothetical protein
MVAQTGFEVVDAVSLEAANKFDLDSSRRDACDVASFTPRVPLNFAALSQLR